MRGGRRHLAIQAQVDALFPEPGSVEGREPTLAEIGLPNLPGHEIVEMIGHGDIGVVYKALHPRLNRTVALKMLIAGPWATQPQRQRFAKEAELVARLKHPNIVQIYDIGDLGGRPYFTVAFIDGGSLDRMLVGTPRPALRAAKLLATLAEAIDAARREGVIHRDLKPSNVLLSTDGTPKISDFGLARHLEVGSALTQSGVTAGTPSYMAPEQARGKANEIGPPADLYSLGAAYYGLHAPAIPAHLAEEVRRWLIDGPAGQGLDRANWTHAELVDREWRYTYVNAQAERHVGRLRSELLGRCVWDEFPFIRAAPQPGCSAPSGTSPGARRRGGSSTRPGRLPRASS